MRYLTAVSSIVARNTYTQQFIQDGVPRYSSFVISCSVCNTSWRMGLG
ncbi:hypothetical protein [Dysgonomonas sp. 216]|nr:hypothetical protein [Dysgonomonas sp. 216]